MWRLYDYPQWIVGGFVQEVVEARHGSALAAPVDLLVSEGVGGLLSFQQSGSEQVG